jgi:anti-sigma factor RsiW
MAGVQEMFVPQVIRMRCADLRELATEYQEGALSSLQRRRVEEHLETCVDCRTYLYELRATRGVLSGLADQPVSAQAREALLQDFRAWKLKRELSP